MTWILTEAINFDFLSIESPLQRAYSVKENCDYKYPLARVQSLKSTATKELAVLDKDFYHIKLLLC